jgi:hypothetical protein
MTARIKRFIVPTYAAFVGDVIGLPKLHQFRTEGNNLHQLGAELYQHGYYSCESPSIHRSRILSRLELWLDLEDRKPRIRSKEPETYQTLYSTFEKALANKDWSSAQACLYDLRRLNLTTADNLMFMQVRMLAEQERWRELYEHPDFDLLVKMRMPRAVRIALLKAFHRAKLMPLEAEESWEKAYTVFKEQRSQLGLLLTGRFEIADDAVVRVFGYQALFDGDSSTIKELLREATDSKTQRCLRQLEGMLTQAPKAPVSPTDIVSQVRAALLDNDYETASRIAVDINDPIFQTLLYIELAFYSADSLMIEKALSMYGSLSSTQYEALRASHNYVDRYVDFLEQLSSPNAPSLEENREILPWHESVWTTAEELERRNAWKAICELEARLRRLIESRYEAKHGEDWIHQVPTEWREAWTKARTKDERTFAHYEQTPSSLLDYSYLNDLLALINKEWSVFHDVFGSGKAAKRKLQSNIEAIVRVRNPLAHNRSVPSNELKRAEVYCTDILLQLKQSSNENVKAGE